MLDPRRTDPLVPVAPRTLVATATYNERENLPALVDALRREVPPAEILVVDDNSPDGTGQWCDERAGSDPQFHVVHRAGKLGLGTATMAALRYAVEEHFDRVVVLDADFSHPPRYIPALLAALDDPASPVDVVVGSRYVAGGGVEGWPLRRKLMSRGVNFYARCLLGLPTRDCSGAFRCFRVDILRQFPWEQIRSTGYSFQEEFLWHLHRRGARMREVPFVFVDRQWGRSKINSREAWSALRILFQLGLRRITGRA